MKQPTSFLLPFLLATPFLLPLLLPLLPLTLTGCPPANPSQTEAESARQLTGGVVWEDIDEGTPWQMRRTRIPNGWLVVINGEAMVIDDPTRIWGAAPVQSGS